MKRFVIPVVSLFFLCTGHVRAAQDYYAGAVAVLATLSADGQSVVSSTESRTSLYKPENGPAVNVFLGRYLGNYVSLQGNFIWNANTLTFTSNTIAPAATSYYQERRGSSQASAVADVLVFFRERGSLLRPYLSAGAGLVHVHSSIQQVDVVAGSPALPPPSFSANKAVLRVAVGMDVRLGRGFSLRYSFSESISSNPISGQLSPPGNRGLKNFQNLSGFLKTF